MFHIPNCGLLEPTDEYSHADYDSRGIIKIFEPPIPNAIYAIGVDVSNGLTNWSRELRTDADSRTDNGAIEVIKKGNPDIQAAEYAAPIEPEDLADVANFLGRLYCGNHEEGQALCIVEIHPGPGMRTQREMIGKYNYFNMYVNKAPDSLVYKPTQHIGWVATPKSIRDMWGRASRHIHKKSVKINSPWLVEEMANINMRPDLMWGEGAGRKHDDRVRAFMLAIWALHDWDIGYDMDDQQPVENTKVVDYQATDISMEDIGDNWQEHFDRVTAGED